MFYPHHRLTPPPRCRHTLYSIAHIDEKNQAIKHLEDELHVRGVEGAEETVEGIIEVGRTEKEGAIIRGGREGARIHQDRYHDQDSSTAPGTKMETRRGGGEEEEAEWCTRHHILPQALSSGKQLVTALSGLRSELQCVSTQVV